MRILTQKRPKIACFGPNMTVSRGGYQTHNFTFLVNMTPRLWKDMHFHKNMTFWLFQAPNYGLKNALKSRFKKANIEVCFCVSKTQSVAFEFYKFGFWSREILKLERYWRFWMSIFLVLAENHPKKHVFWVVSHDTRMPNRWAKVRFLLVWYPPGQGRSSALFCTPCTPWK